MNATRSAAQAYATAATHRSLREQEADVFRQASATLRRARATGDLAVAKAMADNERLWNMVVDLVRDPGNALPAPMRAALVSIGQVVRRELSADAPDLEFIATINETIARGLAGSPG